MTLLLTKDDAHGGRDLCWLGKGLQRSYGGLIAETDAQSKRDLCSDVPSFGGVDVHLVEEDGAD